VTRFKRVDFQAVKIQTSGAGTEGREMIQCNGSRSSLVRVVASAVLAGLSMFDQAAFAAERAADLASHVSQDYPFLESLYRDLHAHPELSFREEKTAAKLARELKANGVEVTTGVGGHGLVGVLRNGPGPTVLVRTDLDALPVREQTGLPFASRARMTNDLGVEVDVMHACGHDVHITSLVGTARQLARLKESWSGTVVFLGRARPSRSRNTPGWRGC
jgi:hypothetical protein